MGSLRVSVSLKIRGISRHVLLALSSTAILSPFAVMLTILFYSTPFHKTTGIIVLDNFLRAVKVVPFLRFMINGAFVAVAICVFQVIIAAPCAYALAGLRFPGRSILLHCFVLGMAIPTQVTALPMFLVLNILGIVDTYYALVVPFVVSPFAVFLLHQVFKAVPTDLIDAARMNGMSEAGIVWQLMVPISFPTIAALSILSIVSRWNSLFWPSIAVRSEHLMPPALGILYFRNNEAGDEYGALMAAAVLVVAPLLIWFLLAQRRFIESLTVGAVK